MKKIFTLFIAGLFASTLFAQPTFVPTTPSNKNVILEDFTGRTCQFCPDGHVRANTIAAANPGRFWDVMIHAGDFAPTSSPNYHSSDGDIIHNNYVASISGYPCGMINRGAILGRGDWSANATTALSQASCANIAAQGTLDFTTRTLTLTVELYYTAASTASSNFVTVAMLQNNILGPQTGGASNPEQYIGGTGNNYNHMHVLRDIITPTWGDTVTTTTATSFFTKTYTYVIPENIQNIPVVLENLEFLVWVAEGKSTIITGNQAKITNLNLPDNIAAFPGTLQQNFVFSCTPVTDMFLQVRAGSDTIKSMEITYSVAGGTPITYTWNNRDIPTLAYDTIYIPSVAIAPGINQTISMQITKINGNPVSLASRTNTVRKNIVTGVDRMTFLLTQDRYGEETYWFFLDADQNIISNGGPYTRLGSNTTLTHEIPLTAPSLGCYALIVVDLYGDGINSSYGAGNLKVIDPSNPDGDPILYDNGKFGAEALYMIDVTGYTSIDEQSAASFSIYPNPASEQLFIRSSEPIKQIEIFNMHGQLVKTEQGNNPEISVSDLTEGIYMLRLVTEKGIAVQKFIKQ